MSMTPAPRMVIRSSSRPARSACAKSMVSTLELGLERALRVRCEIVAVGAAEQHGPGGEIDREAAPQMQRAADPRAGGKVHDPASAPVGQVDRILQRPGVLGPAVAHGAEVAHVERPRARTASRGPPSGPPRRRRFRSPWTRTGSRVSTSREPRSAIAWAKASRPVRRRVAGVLPA